MELRDLPLKKDVKGGNTPLPIPVEPSALWRSLAITISTLLAISAILIAVGIHIAKADALEQRVTNIEAEIKKMNKEGTDYTRWQLGEDQKFHDDVENRLRRIETMK